MSRTLARQKLCAAADALACAQSNMLAAAEQLAADPHPRVQLDGASLLLVAEGLASMQAETSVIAAELVVPVIPPTVCQECD